MEKLKQRLLKFQFKGILAVLLIFSMMSAILFVERSGIRYNYEARVLDFLPSDAVVTKAEACKALDKDCLLIADSTEAESVSMTNQLKVILSDMKVGYDLVDLSEEEVSDYKSYKTAIVALANLSPLGEKIIGLCDWVYAGGRVMFPVTLMKNGHFSVIETKLGIVDSSYENTLVESIYVDEGFMIGGGRAFDIDGAFESALGLQLSDENTRVHAWTNDERKLPLIWEASYGKGKFVVDNFGLYEKVMRGFFAASYSLLEDVSVYPVINGSTFYLDDFPSQIPSGDSSYIRRDYNTTIRDFYVNIWWPDMMNFADIYDLRYTGLAIECYDDAVDGTTDAAPDEGTFLNFGNMLMRQGGEIGYHGYNHQPLCLGNVDYKGEFDYKTWESTSAMKEAFDELVDLCDRLFPGVNMSVYIPPSNILSKEGREFLLSEYPQIKTISGIYFEDASVEVSCVQEYDVSKDGVVDQPRVAWGCKLDNFMSLAAISELNFHFINNHFTHPDDALDPDRGAKLGWEKLKQHFGEYLNWLYSSAPGIRNLTGSEMSAAVQRYVAAVVDKNVTADKMTINIENFYDEAYIMMRFNKGTPGKTSGGSLTHLTGDLYLLKAKEKTVTVDIGRK